MPNVHHTVSRSDATTGKISSVEIRLITGDDRPVAFQKSTQFGIDTYLSIKPTSNTWSVNLISNLDIAPNNSVYKVTEYMSDRRYPATWFVSVPNGTGPYELTTILTTAPNGLPPAVQIIQGGLSESMVDNKIIAHVGDTTPHPAYDDLPSFQLLFENGLV